MGRIHAGQPLVESGKTGPGALPDQTDQVGVSHLTMADNMPEIGVRVGQLVGPAIHAVARE